MALALGTHLGTYEVVAPFGAGGMHPDGKRFAVLMTPGTELIAAVNRVNFIFNLCDAVRRKVPVSGK